MLLTSVKIQAENYVVHVGENALDKFQEFTNANYDTCKKFILVDENTHNYCLPKIDLSVDCLKNTEIIEIESGEQNKTLEIASSLWQTLSERKADRDSLIINLGGGVLCDIGGFVASTFKRGIDFINIPTTLLAQVDASVGGKTGIDFENIKNQIGVFANPSAVFIFPYFLDTLEKPHILSGFAEVIKHALIYDLPYWNKIKKTNLSKQTDFYSLIYKSIEIKNEIVLRDPFEKNLRKCLNFGHTIGHAVESFFLETNRPILHGEAVAIGIVCETYLSLKKLQLTLDELNDIVSLINVIYPYQLIERDDYHRLIEFMKHDKKNKKSQISFTLLDKIGSAQIDQSCSVDEIIDALDFYAASKKDN